MNKYVDENGKYKTEFREAYFYKKLLLDLLTHTDWTVTIPAESKDEYSDVIELSGAADRVTYRP